MKTIILMATFLLVTSGIAVACHNGDNSQLRGHQSKLPFGLLITYEQTSASISTSTSCNWYAKLLDHQYDQVAENAAQGSGVYINLIADSHGCSPEVHQLFGAEIKAHHSEIFDAISEQTPRVLMQRFQGLINGDPILSSSCQHRV